MTPAKRMRCWVLWLFMTECDSIDYELPPGPNQQERRDAARAALDAINADLERDPPTNEEWQSALADFATGGDQ